VANLALSLAAAAVLAAGTIGVARADDTPMSKDPSTDAAATPADPKAGADACIDENVKADLFAKRKQRTSRERLFQQTNRHELTVQGGYYVSDLFDGTYTVGGAYTYHMTEDLGVEASAGYTRLTSSGGPELERTFAVLQGKPRRQLTFDADLVWAPAQLTWTNGGEAMGMIPTRYPGSEQAADNALRLARKTQWQPLGDEQYAGLGQRASRRSSRACRRDASVTRSPPSMRASSSTRAVAGSRVTLVRVAPRATRFSTSRCWPA